MQISGASLSSHYAEFGGDEVGNSAFAKSGDTSSPFTVVAPNDGVDHIVDHDRDDIFASGKKGQKDKPSVTISTGGNGDFTVTCGPGTSPSATVEGNQVKGQCKPNGKDKKEPSGGGDSGQGGEGVRMSPGGAPILD
jgi:hypothetical protein